MAQCCQLIKEAFPKINDDIYSYVESVLESSADDFENEEDVYEAIGEVLLDLETDKSEEDVRYIPVPVPVPKDPHFFSVADSHPKDVVEKM
jgi:ATP-binding cassette, subfamily F, member 3